MMYIHSSRSADGNDERGSTRKGSWRRRRKKKRRKGRAIVGEQTLSMIFIEGLPDIEL